MEIAGKIIVVTGAARGIGRALAERFAALGAEGIVLADRAGEEVDAVASAIGGVAQRCDVAQEADVRELVDTALDRFGRIDLFCANAGILGAGGPEAPNDLWQRLWEVNVLSHVYAARYVLPPMIAQGGGYFLSTASAAGLLTSLDALPYAVTKHGAVALAEWIAIQYHHLGIKVSCLCPQGVQTAMLEEAAGPAADQLREGSVSALEVAEAVVAGLAEERFLILPHPIVREYFLHKAQDYDRWLRGMRRLYGTLHPPNSNSPRAGTSG